MKQKLATLQEISQPKYYNNRERSWLAFNERVLEEAEDERNPLLERLRFLAIFSSNLDEFFMVRVAGLQDQVKAGFHKPENKAGLTPKEQLARIEARTRQLITRQIDVYKELVFQQLPREQVFIRKMDSLTVEQHEFIQNYFDETIFPVLTPIAVDAYRPFPTLLNKTQNLIVLLEREEEEDEELRKKMAIVQVPSVLDRFIQLPSAQHEIHGVLLEDVIVQNIDEMFRGYKVKSVQGFRLTRNADLTIHEEGGPYLRILWPALDTHVM